MTAREERPITQVLMFNNVADLPLGDYLRWIARTLEPETRRELERRAKQADSHEALVKALDDVLADYEQGTKAFVGDVGTTAHRPSVVKARAAIDAARGKATPLPSAAAPSAQSP